MVSTRLKKCSSNWIISQNRDGKKTYLKPPPSNYPIGIIVLYICLDLPSVTIKTNQPSFGSHPKNNRKKNTPPRCPEVKVVHHMHDLEKDQRLVGGRAIGHTYCFKNGAFWGPYEWHCLMYSLGVSDPNK